MKKRFILCSLVLGMSAATVSCGGDEYFYDYSSDTTVVINNISIYDTTIVTVQGDTVSFYNAVNIEGDTINNTVTVTVEGDSLAIDNSSRSYSDPEIDVSGGTVNGGTTNVNTGGNSTNGNSGGDDNGGGDNSNATSNNDTLLIKIPVQDFHKAFIYECLKKESSTGRATFATSFPDTTRMIAICFFDATRLDSTTLSFPTRIPAHENNRVFYPSVRTQGKFGADEDRTKRIVALNIDEGWGEMVDLGCVHENGIDYRALSGDVWISGFEAGHGNNADYATGRTLVGTDGEYVYILHLKEAKSDEAAEVFKQMRVCSPPYAEIAGGSFSNGLKKSPIHLRVLPAWATIAPKSLFKESFEIK